MENLQTRSGLASLHYNLAGQQEPDGNICFNLSKDFPLSFCPSRTDMFVKGISFFTHLAVQIRVQQHEGAGESVNCV